MNKKNIIVLFLLCFLAFHKVTISQLYLEKNTTSKLVELDTSKVIKLFSNQRNQFEGVIKSINDTAFVMNVNIEKDTLINSKIFYVNFDEVYKIQYCDKKNLSNCDKKRWYIIPVSVGASVLTLIILGRDFEGYQIALTLSAGFFAPILYTELTKPKTYKTMGKWKINGCSNIELHF